MNFPGKTSEGLLHITLAFRKEKPMRFVFMMSACALSVLGLLGRGPTTVAAEKRGSARRATVRVLLPAGARLTVDGKKVPESQQNHRFATPPLEKGKKYTYAFQAKYTRGQKTISVRRKVTLRAGQNKVVSLGRSRAYGRSSRVANAQSSQASGYS